MAKNIIHETARTLSVTPTNGGALSGDPGIFGDLPFVALTDIAKGGNAAGRCTAQFSGVAEVSVKGVNSGGNSAVAEGDVIYYQTGDTPKLSKKATSGVRFGVAVARPDATSTALVSSGGTATIRVRIGA